MTRATIRSAAIAACATLALGGVLAACSSSSSSTSTTTKPPSTTTTTLTSAQKAVLEPLLLTTADFPAGWKSDTQPNAGSTQDTPACVADLVLVKGSGSHLVAVFEGPGSQPAAAIQTVAVFAPGRAVASVKSLQANFATCDKGTLNQNGSKATISIVPLKVPSTGDGGFAAQMVLTGNGAKAYLDVFYAVKGANATFLGWEDTSSSTTEFTLLTTKALARL